MLAVLILAVSFAIIISAMCSVFEAVLYSLSIAHVELMSESHPKQAGIMKRLKENIDQPITAILTLNTIANTIGAAVAGAAAVAVFGQGSLLWFSLTFTLAILLCSEILPKNIGVAYSKQLAPYIAQPLAAMILLLKPAIWLCKAVTRLVPDSEQANQISAAEVKTIARLSRKSGEIEANQELVISNILQLGDKSVRQVMTPRTVTFSLEKSLSIEEASQFEDKWRMHSRVPVYNSDTDNVVGIVMTQDVLMALAMDQDKLTLGKMMGPVHFVPETAPLDRVFVDFFDRHQHLFVVVDEYGSVTGVISMEDIIEEIVGREIVDESDETKNMRELARIRKKLVPVEESNEITAPEQLDDSEHA